MDDTSKGSQDSTFTIHKWHSSASELEPTNKVSTGPEGLTNAISYLSRSRQPVGKLLSLPWDRQRNTMSVTLTPDRGTMTKRGVLSNLTKIYDPLGLASSSFLTGVHICRDIWDTKFPWDTNLPDSLMKQWETWNSSLETFTIARSLAPHRKPIS